MKRRVAGPMSVLAITFMVVVDVLATCGGGGGGGTGGMGGGAHGRGRLPGPLEACSMRPTSPPPAGSSSTGSRPPRTS